MEFQCSVEEMDVEKSHMGKLLEVLTNYSSLGCVFIVMVYFETGMYIAASGEPSVQIFRNWYP